MMMSPWTFLLLTAPLECCAALAARGGAMRRSVSGEDGAASAAADKIGAGAGAASKKSREADSTAVGRRAGERRQGQRTMQDLSDLAFTIFVAVATLLAALVGVEAIDVSQLPFSHLFALLVASSTIIFACFIATSSGPGRRP